MRLFPLAIVLMMLTLAGCAELEIRDDASSETVNETASETTDEAGGDARNASEAPSGDTTLYRLESAPEPQDTRPASEPAPDYGLWTRLAQDFTLHATVHDRIDRELFGYMGRLDQLHTITQRAEPYLFFIVEQLRERNMPMELALLPIVESAYQPQATSRSQAAGLWQFIPSTGQHFGLKQNWWYDGRRDVQASTQAALDYLQRLNDMFGGDWALALASYNAGEGTVSRAIERAAARGQPTDYWSLDLPEETKAYVPRLIALARLFHDPHVYGLNPHKVEDTPFLARIDLDRSLDLSKLANAVDMSLDDLYRFNPGFKRGVNGNGREAVALMLPQDKASRLQELNLDELSASLSKPRQVVAPRNESASSLARRYRVDVASLRDMNPKLGNKVRRGDKLLLPASEPAREQDDAPAPITVVSNTPRADKGSYSISHDVQPGDNLFSVSRKHGVDVAALASWNGLKTDSMLRAGQKLTIHAAPARTTETKAGEKKDRAAKVAEAPARKAVTYTVQKGDTLYGIARRFKVEVAQILHWNNMQEKDDLRPGQNIVVAMLDPSSTKAS